MAKHRLTAEDIEDLEDVEINDPYLRQFVTRFTVAGEFDEDHG